MTIIIKYKYRLTVKNIANIFARSKIRGKITTIWQKDTLESIETKIKVRDTFDYFDTN